MIQTKADHIREWFSDKPAPADTRDCHECARAVGTDADHVWIVMRHETTPEKRRTYYREYARNRYATDPAFRMARMNASARARARKRQEVAP